MDAEKEMTDSVNDVKDYQCSAKTQNLIKFFIEPYAAMQEAGFDEPNDGDIGYDLRAAESVTLFEGQQKIIPTGLRLAIPDSYMGLIKDRSSMVARQIYVHAGVIDPSYRGQVSVILENRSRGNYHIEAGDKIAQIAFVSVLTPKLVQVSSRNDLGETQRGDGSFGSTGK